jgi:hypothetical protein
MAIIGIMQPYFLPYIGYFQLMYAVDKMVIYDNIQYTKKGWINRNRILVNCQPEYISIPLAKGSDYDFVVERNLSADWIQHKQKLKNRIRESYRKAPHFEIIYNQIEHILDFENFNLFNFLYNSLQEINKLLGIQTEILFSSEIAIDHSLRSEEKVKAICQALEATTYVNPIGGKNLYDPERFKKSGLELQFIQAQFQEYSQFNCTFVPWLSIIDVLMFNDLEYIKHHILPAYEIITT